MKISQEKLLKIPYKQRNGIYEIENYGTIYYVNGKAHRDDGPAYKHINGYKYWCINGKYHRLDGPAREYSDYYTSWVEYYIENKRYYTK